jgi:predicted nucleotidyltransferase
VLFSEPFGGLIPGARGAVLAVLLRTDAPLTGRQIHALVKPTHSLWAVQEVLKSLHQLGLVHSRSIGRAGVHTINENHVSIPPLRALLDPITALTDTVRAAVSDEVQTVILFGSVARGESTDASDIDLAVIAPAGWDGRSDLEDTVRARLGNDCGVLVLTPDDFTPPAAGEPVVQDILSHGVALLGSMPMVQTGVTR